MLRAVIAFVVALILGTAASVVLVGRFAPLPTPSDSGSPDAIAASATATAQALQAAPMQHIPAWVQTNRPATLWSSPDRTAQGFTSLPVWTFLKVTGVQDGSLLVQYAGDGKSRQAGPGWVHLDDIQPSDAGDLQWLRNHRTSQLFSGATNSTAVLPVQQWSWLVSLGDSQAGRLHVRLYASDLRSIVGDGWIPTGDVGPSGAPSQSVYTGTTSAAPGSDVLSHDQFIAALGSSARASIGQTQIPVSVTVAQAILESNWGQSLLSREAKNYFGIKATGGIGNDGAVWMPTLEAAQGGTFTVVAPFRAYKTMADSVADHSALFSRVSVYQGALQALGDPDEFARRIGSAGYATDPNYSSKLIALMRQYDLYKLDAQIVEIGPPAPTS